jgi:hypothetical protein
MRELGHSLLGILWPPASPIYSPEAGSAVEGLWWKLLAAALVIPLTAVWHHAVFYSPRCMLNDFGPDYTPDVVATWLARDPSLPWAMMTALVIYGLGNRWRLVRVLAAPAFLAFLPLAVWIWDIPFTGRIVCDWGHDKKAPLGFVMRTRYLYLAGALIYVVLLGLTLARQAQTRLSQDEKAPST